MPQELPTGGKLVLWKVDGNWSFNAFYPAGATVPSDAKPFNIHNHGSFSEMYKDVLKYIDDQPLKGGKPPAADPTSEPDELEDGTLVMLERTRDSWKSTIFFRDGGMSFRHSHYFTIADALVGLHLFHNEG